jgi:hypothetical protein
MFQEMRYMPVSTARCIDSAQGTISSRDMGLAVTHKQLCRHWRTTLSFCEETAWLAQGVQDIVVPGSLWTLTNELQIICERAKLSRPAKTCPYQPIMISTIVLMLVLIIQWKGILP